jgi:hypothetical protein
MIPTQLGQQLGLGTRNTPCVLTCALPYRYNELMSDAAYVDSVLAKGAATANETAQRTLDNCKDAMGFVVPGLSK